MSLWAKLSHLLPSRSRAEERDMQEELASLREMAGAGELGNLTLAAENARATWTWLWLERLGQDLRYALRSMFHNKAFTALAVLSLALGIGANTAIYSFMESILLRSLPVPEPESLVVMKWRSQTSYTSAASKGMSFSTEGTHREPSEGTIGTQFPYPALELFQRNTDVLSNAFCYFVRDGLTLTIDGESEAVKGQYVSGDYFRGMGVRPSAGRLVLPGDDEAGAAGVAVLSHGFSQRRFGDARFAVGRTIRISDKPFSVVGVTPPGFFGAEPGYVPDLYIPMRAEMVVDSASGRKYLDPNFYWIEIMGRLKPGVDPVQAQAVLGPQFRRFAEDSATSDRARADLPELRIMKGGTGLDSLSRRYAKPLYVLMAMVSLILLIACANVANLLLARAAARRREIAVRLSIGASRMRVIRQLLTESVVLSSIGGVLGLAFAWWGIRVLTALLANGRENFTLHAELNWNVLSVALALSVLTGLVFGLVPAIQATRVDLMPALKETRPGALAGTAGRSWRRVGPSQILVVAQMVFALVLVVAAGLFGGTLSNLHSIGLGFNRDNVLLFTIMPEAVGYDGPSRKRLYRDVREKLGQVPGVRSVSLSNRPLPAGGGTMAPVIAAGVPPPPAAPGERAPNAAGLFSVGPAFFDTMQIPLTAGREFDERDETGAASVAVINQRLAKVLGLENPVGSRISLAGQNTMYEIVGVVGDALFLRLKDEIRPMVYFPYLRDPYLRGSAPGEMTYEMRAAGNPLGLANIVRQIVRQADYRLAVSDLKTQAAHIDEAISQEIALARLCTVFALLALVIACVGLYGTVAFNVSRRTSEIGIRMALGAQRAGVVWLVLRSVLTLELLGLAIGIPVVLAGSRYVESLLFGIKPNDPMALMAGVAVLFAAGLLASYVPARRASSIDPMVAVRHE
jgi:macrolide transport system ATP-binding/permease protein